jgi:hypothetical protein
MASIAASLEVESHNFRLLHCTFRINQVINSRGRAVEKARCSPVELVLDVPAGDFLLAWAANPLKRVAVNIVFSNAATGSALETLSLPAAYCVAYQEEFVHGDVQEGAYQCSLTLADPDGFTLQPGGPTVAVAAPAVGQLVEAGAQTPAVLAATAGASASPLVESAPNYATTALDPDYVGEETGDVWGTAVKYLSATERKAYELAVQPDGLLYNAQGQLFDTQNAGTVTGKGKAIFVMSEAGEIYASLDQKPGLFHHSSFLAGGPVAAAGEIQVLNGMVTAVSNRSGHYTPDHTYTQQFVEQLWRKGVKNTADIKIEDFDH